MGAVQRSWFHLIGAILVLSTGFPEPAEALFVSRPVDATLTIAIPGVEPFNLTSAGHVSVEVGTGSIAVPAALVTLPSATIVPVTTTTAIASVTATHLANQAGTFSWGGANLSGELCPPAADSACVGGTGFGGQLALSGTVAVHIIPDIVVIPIDLDNARIGQGGAVSTPLSFDAAPWTTGAGQVRTASGTFLLSGTNDLGSVPNQLTLVTPTYVSAVGFIAPVFLELTLEFEAPVVPEPSTGTLLAAGCAAALGLRRRR
ncbi:MAG: PEP-CTERM sorting domain-containing protein [Myxococcota bacterium]